MHLLHGFPFVSSFHDNFMHSPHILCNLYSRLSTLELRLRTAGEVMADREVVYEKVS